MVGDDLMVTVLEIVANFVLISVSRRKSSADPKSFNEVAQARLKRHEAISLGPNASCRFVHVRGKRVRLGFMVPTTMRVDRKEIYDVMHSKSGDDGTAGG